VEKVDRASSSSPAGEDVVLTDSKSEAPSEIQIPAAELEVISAIEAELTSTKVKIADHEAAKVELLKRVAKLQADRVAAVEVISRLHKLDHSLPWTFNPVRGVFTRIVNE